MTISNLIENTVEIGEIARKQYGKGRNFYHTISTFNNPEKEKKPFDTIVGKGENAGNQQFLLFPRYFPPREELSLQQYLLCCVQMLLI